MSFPDLEMIIFYGCVKHRARMEVWAFRQKCQPYSPQCITNWQGTSPAQDKRDLFFPILFFIMNATKVIWYFVALVQDTSFIFNHNQRGMQYQPFALYKQVKLIELVLSSLKDKASFQG